MVKTMSAGVFKAQCLKVMDEVRASRKEVVLTKRGVPVAKLVPVEAEPPDIFDCMRGSMQIVGDIVAPVVEPEEWEAFR